MKIKCSVCGNISEFNNGNEDCACGMKVRSNGLYRALKDEITPDSYILEPQTYGKIHELLIHHPHYISTKYIDGIKSGTIVNGIRIEDLMNPSFYNDSLDMIIFQDILEHVSNYVDALIEIKRILKVGGSLYMSIPIEGTITRTIAHVSNGHMIYDEPPYFHDSERGPKTSPVFTIFGPDIINVMNDIFEECVVLPFEFKENMMFKATKK